MKNTKKCYSIGSVKLKLLSLEVHSCFLFNRSTISGKYEELPVFCVVRVAQSLVFCVAFCSPLLLLLLAICLSVFYFFWPYVCPSSTSFGHMSVRLLLLLAIVFSIGLLLLLAIVLSVRLLLLLAIVLSVRLRFTSADDYVGINNPFLSIHYNEGLLFPAFSV